MATLSKKSPLTGKTDLVTFRLMAKVGGQMKALSEAYQVLDIEVEKSVNRIATESCLLYHLLRVIMKPLKCLKKINLLMGKI
jgi:hypothetical protein